MKRTKENICTRFRLYLLRLSIASISLSAFAGCDQEARLAEIIRKDDVSALRPLLEQHPEILNATNRYGSTLLLGAGSIQMVKFLVANGANVKAKDRTGTTALHLAALRGQTEVVNLLLQKGSDVNATESDGSTPLHYAAWNISLEWSSSRPKDQVIESLLAAGADINARTLSGSTPLHVAVRSGCSNEVRVLLDRGATVNCQDVSGQTPLHAVATAPGHPHVEQITRLLLNRGANVQAKEEKNSWTPLHFAAANGNIVVLRALLEKGAEPNAQDNYGWTPLHRGVCHGEVVRLLLENGADIGATTKHGYTVWTLVTKPHLSEDRSEIVKILREHRKAEPNAAPLPRDPPTGHSEGER